MSKPRFINRKKEEKKSEETFLNEGVFQVEPKKSAEDENINEICKKPKFINKKNETKVKSLNNLDQDEAINCEGNENNVLQNNQFEVYKKPSLDEGVSTKKKGCQKKIKKNQTNEVQIFEIPNSIERNEWFEEYENKNNKKIQGNISKKNENPSLFYEREQELEEEEYIKINSQKNIKQKTDISIKEENKDMLDYEKSYSKKDISKVDISMKNEKKDRQERTEDKIKPFNNKSLNFRDNGGFGNDFLPKKDWNKESMNPLFEGDRNLGKELQKKYDIKYILKELANIKNMLMKTKSEKMKILTVILNSFSKKNSDFENETRKIIDLLVDLADNDEEKAVEIINLFFCEVSFYETIKEEIGKSNHVFKDNEFTEMLNMISNLKLLLEFLLKHSFSNMKAIENFPLTCIIENVEMILEGPKQKPKEIEKLKNLQKTFEEYRSTIKERKKLEINQKLIPNQENKVETLNYFPSKPKDVPITYKFESIIEQKDILGKAPEIFPHVIGSKYDSWEQYLNNMFHLLKEVI